MKTVTPELADHLSQETTSLTVCWRLTRVDGTRYHFTALDIDIDFDIGDGVETYVSIASFTRSAISNTDDLAVDNLDVFGVLGAVVDPLDLERGLFNNAEIEIFGVNWQDLTMGPIKLRRGWIGEVISTPEGVFKAELRGLTQSLIRRLGRIIGPECDADLGDSRCTVPIFPDLVLRGHAYVAGNHVRGPTGGEPLYICTVAGTTAGSAPSYDPTLDALTTDGGATFKSVNPWSRFCTVNGVSLDIPRKRFTVAELMPPSHDESVLDPSVPGRGFYPDGSMNNGVVTWTTGANVGVSMEIREFFAGDPMAETAHCTIELYLPLPFDIQVGDTCRVYRGCLKRLFADCRDTFDNVPNFRGFPSIPGSDFLAQYPSIPQ
jgi:hypothetical protein